MKFRCEREILADALTTAGRAATSRSGTLPVLSGVRLDVAGGELTVTGTLTNERGTLRLGSQNWAQTAVVQTDGTNVLRIETPGTTTIKSLVSDRDVVLAPSVEQALGLALREAVTNVVRHAQARHCTIRLAEVDGEVRLEVDDDGVGGAVAPGNGLTGMQERMAALGGVIVSSRIMAGAYNVGEGLEFEVIAAVVIGGTSLSGGSGSMLGTFVGVLFIGLLANGMTLMGVDPYWQEVARGLIVLIAVLISAARNVRRS